VICSEVTKIKQLFSNISYCRHFSYCPSFFAPGKTFFFFKKQILWGDFSKGGIVGYVDLFQTLHIYYMYPTGVICRVYWAYISLTTRENAPQPAPRLTQFVPVPGYGDTGRPYFSSGEGLRVRKSQGILFGKEGGAEKNNVETRWQDMPYAICVLLQSLWEFFLYQLYLNTLLINTRTPGR